MGYGIIATTTTRLVYTCENVCACVFCMAWKDIRMREWEEMLLLGDDKLVEIRG